MMKLRLATSVLFMSFFTGEICAQEIVFTEDPVNLGPHINTKYTELSPIISPDGKTLYFLRRAYPQNIGSEKYDDIWYSNLQPDGTWGEAVNMGSPLNNAGTNFLESITPDGNTILLGNVYNYFDGSTSSGCSISHRDKGGWTFPKKQNIEKYENKNEHVSYTLSNDGKILLMAIEMRKGYGDLDLHVSFRKSENNWTKPLNLGPVINTAKNENGCFLAADGKTLIFYSAGQPGGYGGCDIWISKRLDDTWTSWSKPLNMGPKINTKGFDAYFSIAASGDYAYYISSTNSIGEEDVFRIKMPTEAKPDPVVLMYGKVLNIKDKQPVRAEITYELLPGGEEVGIANSEPENGTYKIVLPNGKNYGFRAVAEGFYAVNEFIDLSGLTEYEEINRDLYLAPIEKDQVIRLNNIFFESGKSVLMSESFPELNRVVQLLTDNPAIEIALQGHTDNVGSDDANLQLSQDRAQAVVDYLVENGIKKSRLAAQGYGETMPVATNESDEGRAMNRRVEFKIIKG